VRDEAARRPSSAAAAAVVAAQQRGLWQLAASRHTCFANNSPTQPPHPPTSKQVGLIQADMTPEARRAAYASDITYVTNSELGFDYLRDNLSGVSYHPSVIRRGQRLRPDVLRTLLRGQGVGCWGGECLDPQAEQSTRAQSAAGHALKTPHNIPPFPHVQRSPPQSWCCAPRRPSTFV
jgi:hypothetical protein